MVTQLVSGLASVQLHDCLPQTLSYIFVFKPKIISGPQLKSTYTYPPNLYRCMSEITQVWFQTTAINITIKQVTGTFLFPSACKSHVFFTLYCSLLSVQ